MPLYDYRCRACSKVVEVRHGFREAYDAACAECGGQLSRVFNPAGIVFKGSGFYVTDSRKSAPSESSNTSTASGSGSGEAAPKTEGAAKADSSSAKTESSSAKSESKTESSAA